MRVHLSLAVFLLCLATFSANAGTCPAPKPAACPNNPCDNLGTSQLSDDQTAIIACLRKSSGSPTMIWRAMTKAGVPIGAIIAWPVMIDPPDMGDWLECDGQAINQTDYPELFSVVGAHVPNLQGLFLRGRGGQAASVGVVQNYATYVPNATTTITINGITQGYAVTGGRQAPCDMGWSYGATVFPNNGNENGYTGHTCDSVFYQAGGASTFSSTQTISTGASETRPSNMAVRYLIRAKP